MRYLVISDIHANLQAYETVMAHAAPLNYERILVLGDLVGYGADPNIVCERVRALSPHAVIRGNHDKVGSGVESPEGFNAVARNAIRWTYDTLTRENRDWLAALPKGPVIVDDLIEICHGAPFDEDAYVFDDLDALRAMNASRRPLCLFGHTHVPSIFRIEPSVHALLPVRGERCRVPIEAHSRYLVNCGAVGQPRDSDPRAAFGLLDAETRVLTIVRTPYDLAITQTKIVEAGLPPVLAQRLALGR